MFRKKVVIDYEKFLTRRNKPNPSRALGKSPHNTEKNRREKRLKKLFAVVSVAIALVLIPCYSLTLLDADINEDGIVDIADLGIVASAYGTKEGDDRYNPIADLDNNKRVNIVDIAIVAVDFGKTFSTYKLYGLDFGPYTEPGQDPNKRYVVSEEQVRTRMETVAPYTEWVWTFSCTLGMEKAGSIARDLDLKIAVGAWLDKDLSTNEQEISNLISIA